MSFVRSEEEIEQIQSTMEENHFLDSQMLTVEYLTKPDIIEHVLPPGLEPVDRPLVKAMVGRWGRSNCVNAFKGGALYCEARHGDHVADYCLSMPMSTDAAIIWGRELFGEPKKQADTTLSRSGSELHGRVDRYGETIIEIQATMEEKEDVEEGEFHNFHYKYLPDVTGRGFQFDPQLVKCSFRSDVHRMETGAASLSLGNTTHDPLGEIEIVEVLGATYAEADLYSSQKNLTSVDPDEFLPYAYGTGKMDDWLELNNEDEPSTLETEQPVETV